MIDHLAQTLSSESSAKLEGCVGDMPLLRKRVVNRTCTLGSDSLAAEAGPDRSDRHLVGRRRRPSVRDIFMFSVCVWCGSRPCVWVGTYMHAHTGTATRGQGKLTD